MQSNNRITLKQFYDEFIPYIEIVSAIKKDVENINKKLTTYCSENNKDHDKYEKKLDSKISIKAFGAWLGSLSIIIGVILSLIGFIK